MIAVTGRTVIAVQVAMIAPFDEGADGLQRQRSRRIARLGFAGLVDVALVMWNHW